MVAAEALVTAAVASGASACAGASRAEYTPAVDAATAAEGRRGIAEPPAAAAAVAALTTAAAALTVSATERVVCLLSLRGFEPGGFGGFNESPELDFRLKEAGPRGVEPLLVASTTGRIEGGAGAAAVPVATTESVVAFVVKADAATCAPALVPLSPSCCCCL